MFEKLPIISLDIHHLSFTQALNEVVTSGLNHTPSFVCFANAHMVIEAHKDPLFLEKLNKAFLVLADGKPVASACNLLHKKKQERISGMDFTPRILEVSNKKNITIFLYGSTVKVLETLKLKIASTYPKIKIGGAISPPFGKELNEDELQQYIDEINQSGAHIVLVALGCPKQEKWMANNYTKINSVLLGVGGAFPVMAGLQPRAPKWMQDSSLEWLYRLIQEPRRMFNRYVSTNSLFLMLLIKFLVKKKTS